MHTVAIRGQIVARVEEDNSDEEDNTYKKDCY